MNTKKFINTLIKYYKDSIPGTNILCKFYLQASTFSYDLHNINKTCFTEESRIFRSEVYWFDNSKSDRKTIIKDIKAKAKEITKQNQFN